MLLYSKHLCGWLFVVQFLMSLVDVIDVIRFWLSVLKAAGLHCSYLGRQSEEHTQYQEASSEAVARKNNKA